MIQRTVLLAIVLTAIGVFQGQAQVSWQKKLEQELPLLGHRNLIVIADSAYPWQTAPGIETINTGATQLEVVKAVFDVLGHVEHVKPVIFLDAEMAHVAEADARASRLIATR